MRILLRDFRSGLYVGVGRQWTLHPQRARTFASGFEAKAYQVCHRLAEAAVVSMPGAEVRRWRPQFPIEPECTKTRDLKWTTLEAKIELGMGNSLYIRGEGGGLDWHQSQPMTQINPVTWIWSTESATQALVFQLLLNDLIWAKGDNLTAEPGTRLEVVPDFEWPEIPRMACVE